MLPKQLGKYKIERWVASGAYGDLFEAVDTVIEQRVAVKVISLHKSKELAKAKLLREAKYLLELYHPNIVRFYHCDFLGNNLLLFMELLQGKSLRTEIEENHKSVLDQFFTLSVKILETVKYIHDQGILHCDLNTENILLTNENEIKIIDFGLATKGGEIHYGTPSYTAPELWEGKPNSIQSDIFSLACVLYEIIKSKPAFSGNTIDIIKYKIKNKRPAIPKTTNIEIRNVIPLVMKCLKYNPEHRILNCAGFLELLHEQRSKVKSGEITGLRLPPEATKPINHLEPGKTITNELVIRDQRLDKEVLIRLNRDEARGESPLDIDHIIIEIGKYIKLNGKKAFIKYQIQETRKNKNVIINMLCPKGIRCTQTRQTMSEIATEIILESKNYGEDLIPYLINNILTGYPIGKNSAKILAKKYNFADEILLQLLERNNTKILRNVLHGIYELTPNKQLLDSVRMINQKYCNIWYIDGVCQQILKKVENNA